MISEIQQPSIGFSESAARKVGELMVEQDKETLMLRVYIQGGGCSGFQYGFQFEEEVTDGDAVLEKAGVKLLVDPMSFQYLMGAEVDYKEDLMGARFVVTNPNAATTCGCGASFSI